MYLTPDTDLMKSMEPNSCQSVSTAAAAGAVSVTPVEHSQHLHTSLSQREPTSCAPTHQ